MTAAENKAKDIKDYLHLYLGCDCDRSGRLERIDYSFLVWCENNHRLKDVKPILRQLSDMTEEEEKQYHKIRETGYTSNVERQMLNDAAGTKYLLSLGFDLFNLIPDGLAINKSSLKNS